MGYNLSGKRMRLNCKVCLNRASSKAPKPVPGYICVGVGSRTTDENKKANHVIIVTEKKKNTSDKFNVNNIVKLFDKFMDQGKLTIQISEPAVTIFASEMDVSQLRLFVKLIRAIQAGRAPPKLTLATAPSALHKLQVKQQSERSRLVVRNRKEYPYVEGFSTGLRQLTILECKLDKFDPRWRKLKHLTSLTLNNNQFGKMGVLDFRTLEALQAITLSHNDLTEMPLLPSSITDINVSHNRIQHLPVQLFRSYKISNLDVSYNELRLPYAIVHQRHTLQSLRCNNNCVLIFPHVIGMLRLRLCDFSDQQRPTTASSCRPDPMEPGNGAPSLLESALTTAINMRLFHEKLIHLLPGDLALTVKSTDYPMCSECGQWLVRMSRSRVRGTIVDDLCLRSIASTVHSTPSSGELVCIERIRCCTNRMPPSHCMHVD